jgi:hypothetical protein
LIVGNALYFSPTPMILDNPATVRSLVCMLLYWKASSMIESVAGCVRAYSLWEAVLLCVRALQ